MDQFFYRLNCFLIAGVVCYVGFLLVAEPEQVVAQSDETEETTLGGVKVNVLFKDQEVTFEPNNFDVEWVSDGLTDDAVSERKDVFPKEMQIPLDFNLEINRAHVALPGEQIFEAIRSPNAPESIDCKSDEFGDSQHCIKNAMASSIFADISLNKYTFKLNDNDIASADVEESESMFDRFVNFIFTAFTGDGPDTTRKSCGMNAFWGEDELSQFVRINGKLIERIKICVDQTGVLRAVDNSVVDFAPKLANPEYTLPHTSANASEPGFGAITNPFTKELNTEEAENARQEKDEGFLKEFIQGIFGSSESTGSDKTKLSPHVSLRTVDEADTFQAAYHFCEAVEKKGYKPSGEYPNPFEPEFITVTDPDTGATEQRPDPTSDHEKYRRANKGSDTMQCLFALNDYINAGPDPADAPDANGWTQRGIACARDVVNGTGCNDFTAEESSLNFEMVNKTLPVGLVGIQNLLFNDINTDINGPFINYLSPYYCSIASIEYKMSPIKDTKTYVYRYGKNDQESKAEEGEIGDETSSNAVFNNQYCVVGALISNFSWALKTQENYFGNDNFGDINLPVEGLTCDKKETMIHGAVPLEANIVAPDNKLIYMIEDNERGTGVEPIDRENLIIRHGYDIYPLSKIIEETNAQINKYGNYDLRVIVGEANTPKYVLFIDSEKDADEGFSEAELEQLKNGDEAAIRKVMEKQSSISGGNRSNTMYLCRINNQMEGKDSASTGKRCKSLGGAIFGLVVPKVTFTQDAEGNDIITMFEGKVDGGVQASVLQVDKSDITQSEYLTDSPVSLSDTANQFFVEQLSGGAAGIVMYGAGVLDKSLEYVSFDPLSATIGTEARDLCSGQQKTYCDHINDEGIANALVAAGSRSDYVVAAGNGAGLIFNVTRGNVGIPNVFAYNTSVSNGMKDTDPKRAILSSVKVSNRGFHIFMRNTGDYLHVVGPGSNTDGNPREVAEKVGQTCGGNNCMVTLQYQFNPKTFLSDCSDYYGDGQCQNGNITEMFETHKGYKPDDEFSSMNALGSPEVFSFNVKGNGGIYAWYTHAGVSKSIFQSTDMLYAFNGVYGKVSPDNDEDPEYSHAYVPVGGEGIEAQPLRYKNYNNGGFKEQVHLQKMNGFVTDIVDVMRPDKMACLRQFSRVTGKDLYFDQSGIDKDPLSNNKFGFIPGVGITTPSGMTNINPGEYCEESWCVSDSTPLIFNTNFENDGSNELLKRAITDFYLGRMSGAAIGQYGARYRTLVNTMCERSDVSGVACEMIAAIWLQESMGALSGVMLGCMDGSSDFASQVDCAVGSMRSSHGKYELEETLSGPGSVFTAAPPGNAGKSEKIGSCKPATLFSMVHQRYTPLDKRINYNNQCNRGLVVRTDSQALCGNSDSLAIGASPSDRHFAAASTSAEWPNGEFTDDGKRAGSRPNLKYALTKIYEIYEELGGNASDRLQISEQCYPGSTGGTYVDPSSVIDSNMTTDALVQQVLQDYSLTSSKGEFRMRIAGWGTDDAAAYVRMVMNNEFGGKLRGVHSIQPGGSFEFNEVINNPGADDVNAAKDKYVKLGYTFDGSAVIGGGWCETATTVGISAERATQSNGSPVLERRNFNSVAEIGGGGGYGTGRGTTGDINNWEHSQLVGGISVPINTDMFNNRLAVGGDIIEKRDSRKYVAIWSVGGSPGWKNDGDLLISNPTNDTLFIVVSYEDTYQDVIKVTTFTAKEKPGGGDEDDEDSDDEESTPAPGDEGNIPELYASYVPAESYRRKAA